MREWEEFQRGREASEQEIAEGVAKMQTDWRTARRYANAMHESSDFNLNLSYCTDRSI